MAHKHKNSSNDAQGFAKNIYTISTVARKKLGLQRLIDYRSRL